MPPETSIKNLYNTGEGVRAEGWSGTNKAAKTAIEVADTVSKILATKKNSKHWCALRKTT